jgi:hypothetical protein
MSDQKGILRMQLSGRWTICRPGRAPVEITSGDVFRVEVGGELKRTRMESRHRTGGGGEYYSADGYELRSGMSAAIGSGE